MRKQDSVLSVCISAAAALAAALGIGRFAFTPLFPLMVSAHWVDAAEGSWLAAANYSGYLVGALMAGHLSLSATKLLRRGLLPVAVATLGMSLLHGTFWWMSLRFIAGFFGAWVMVGAGVWALNRLMAHHRTPFVVFVYAGIGAGVALSGALPLWLRHLSVGELWAMFGFLALLLAIPAWLNVHSETDILPLAQDAARMVPTPTATHDARGIILAYGMMGFAYILPATYLPMLVKHFYAPSAATGWVWVLFGFMIALSVTALMPTLRHFSRISLWRLAQGVLAIGTLMPVFSVRLSVLLFSALAVGGTFMVIVMLGMQEARIRSPHCPTRLPAHMTAALALGQLTGPLLPLALHGAGYDIYTAIRSAFLLAGILAAGCVVLLCVRQDKSEKIDRSVCSCRHDQ